jgi:presenilin-like A22 family membrane protease
MKHSLKITLFLVALFLVTQLVGLATVNKHIQVATVNGTIEVIHPSTVIGEPPQVEEKSSSWVYIVAGVLLGTALLFVFIRYNVRRLWKYWFLLSVFITLAVSFGVYMRSWLAFALAISLGLWKVYRPNVYVHNLTEIFIYTGIAVIFLPILNMVSASIMLILISVYDMFAVWQSRHMITLAKFQTDSKVFAGLFIPYGKRGREAMAQAAPAQASRQPAKAKGEMKNAILGGGDIAFPLLFASAAMEHLILNQGMLKPVALGLAGIIAMAAAVALLWLLVAAKEDKFYPAMPFISAGCFVGWGLVWMLV